MTAAAGAGADCMGTTVTVERMTDASVSLENATVGIATKEVLIVVPEWETVELAGVSGQAV